MNNYINNIFEDTDVKSIDQAINKLRETLQEITLLALWRIDFFSKAAFYGGTALRILYGLDRFSEDLDFSLLEPDNDFDIGYYTKAIEREINAFGFNIKVEKKEKSQLTNTESAFLKANTLNELLIIEPLKELELNIPKNQLLKIKIEIDITPPEGFSTESKFLLKPIPFPVNTYTLPDLFAGKMHAILCRNWKNRVKGRDWYDLVWYCTYHPVINLDHLSKRMIQTKHLEEEISLTPKLLKKFLTEKIESIDFEQAKKDVLPFLKDQEKVRFWSQDFFKQVVEKIEYL